MRRPKEAEAWAERSLPVFGCIFALIILEGLQVRILDSSSSRLASSDMAAHGKLSVTADIYNTYSWMLQSSGQCFLDMQVQGEKESARA